MSLEVKLVPFVTCCSKGKGSTMKCSFQKMLEKLEK